MAENFRRCENVKAPDTPERCVTRWGFVTLLIVGAVLIAVGVIFDLSVQYEWFPTSGWSFIVLNPIFYIIGAILIIWAFLALAGVVPLPKHMKK